MGCDAEVGGAEGQIGLEELGRVIELLVRILQEGIYFDLEERFCGLGGDRCGRRLVSTLRLGWRQMWRRFRSSRLLRRRNGGNQEGILCCGMIEGEKTFRNLRAWSTGAVFQKTDEEVAECRERFAHGDSSLPLMGRELQ